MIPTTGGHVFLENGMRYSIGPKLAEGGEGVVYEIPGKPDLLLKIYKANKRANANEWRELKQKIVTFEKMHDVLLQITSNVCWIQNAVYFQHKFQGYIVPRVRGIKLSEWFNRKYNTQSMDDHAIIQIARNIAETVKSLHNIQIGKQEWPIVVGDLQPQNIILDEKTYRITIIDSDSFQIGAHECNVQFPTYISPERLKNPNLGKRTCDEENYVLAYLFFQLFMFYGRIHPYPHKNGPASPQDCVRQGFFAYVQDLGGVDSRCVARWTTFSSKLQRLFKQAFYDSHPVRNQSGQIRRPTPEEWLQVLSANMPIGTYSSPAHQPTPQAVSRKQQSTAPIQQTLPSQNVPMSNTGCLIGFIIGFVLVYCSCVLGL